MNKEIKCFNALVFGQDEDHCLSDGYFNVSMKEMGLEELLVLSKMNRKVEVSNLFNIELLAENKKDKLEERTDYNEVFLENGELHFSSSYKYTSGCFCSMDSISVEEINHFFTTGEYLFDRLGFQNIHCFKVQAVDKDVEKINIANHLRWLGFCSGDEVVNISFVDDECNNWEVGFTSRGEQKISLNDNFNDFLSANNEKVLEIVKSIEVAKVIEDKLQNFTSEQIVNFIEHTINCANKNELEKAYLPLLVYLDENDLIYWDMNSWFEHTYLKISNADKLIIDDNIDIGIDIFSSFSEIKDRFSDEEFLEEFVSICNDTLEDVA
ncbi:hypothetical protein [Aliarcobacter butzleri]|uniref:hypothetical protein n=1 Tax=Aliarcobacter butzleri TaxID=28197 RepID=UPI001269F19B|nr:hypothetical protein [Aliarcobacter butzleri]